MKKRNLFIILALVLLALISVIPAAAQSSVTNLTIWWAEWDPANYLQQIGNEYEAATGIHVDIVQTPWPDYYNRVGAEWAAQGTSFDLVVGDSQWIGQGATQDHYVDLTDFLTTPNADGVALADTVTPATLAYYGEYPANSGTYYAYPTEGDANGFAYRRDLFEDPQNMTDFEARYGYPLAVPETWAQLRDIAEFFTRPDDGLYGVGVYTQVAGDALTMGFENVFFSYGGNWQDADNNVLGVVNTPDTVAALEMYRDLYSFAPPGTNDAFFQEMNDAFVGGQAAMIMNYFAFFPALDNPSINPYRDVTGYFPMPAGPNGDRYAALGGQGISVNNAISDDRKQASLDFITWFAQADTQARWAELGGYTCNIDVLQSDTFLNQTPYNRAFADTMTFVKDFWNIPEYASLLEISQRYLNAYVVGGDSNAQDTMDNIAAEQDQVLVDAGYIQP